MEPDSILLLTEQIISNRCGLHGLEFSEFSVNWIATLWIDKLLLKGSFKTFSLQYEISLDIFLLFKTMEFTTRLEQLAVLRNDSGS